MADPQQVKYKTAVVPLGYSWISKEDPRYGGFKTIALIPPGEDQDLHLETCAKLAMSAFGTTDGIKMPYIIDEDGVMRLKAKTKLEPNIYDSLGHPVIGKRPMIASGTLARVGGKFKAYDSSNGKGIVSYLNSIQVAKLASYQQFDAIEGMDDEDLFVEEERQGKDDEFGSLIEDIVVDPKVAGNPADF